MVVGLGNPGEKFAQTRHNVGYRVIDLLKKDPPIGVKLFKPEGYMNSSGVSVAEMARKNGYGPSDILIVCDDFSIPLGMPRIRLGGSSGGHNGLDSIIQFLGTQDIPRLRVGIGPVPPGRDPADFVLEPFSARTSLDEKAQMAVYVIPSVARIVREAIIEGIETAMNRYNNKSL